MQYVLIFIEFFDIDGKFFIYKKFFKIDKEDILIMIIVISLFIVKN